MVSSLELFAWLEVVPFGGNAFEIIDVVLVATKVGTVSPCLTVLDIQKPTSSSIDLY